MRLVAEINKATAAQKLLTLETTVLLAGRTCTLAPSTLDAKREELRRSARSSPFSIRGLLPRAPPRPSSVRKIEQLTVTLKERVRNSTTPSVPEQ